MMTGVKLSARNRLYMDFYGFLENKSSSFKPLLKNNQECDHVRSTFLFDKQSQLSRLSLNLQSTCFGSTLRAGFLMNIVNHAVVTLNSIENLNLRRAIQRTSR